MKEMPRGADLMTLLHAAAAAQEEVESKLATMGLSLARLAALKALADAGESLPLTQLAERLSCVKSNITQLVDRLEADGLVRRELDPRDRRARLATMTDAGRQAWKDGWQAQQEAEAAWLGQLSTVESQQLAALLTKLERR